MTDDAPNRPDESSQSADQSADRTRRSRRRGRRGKSRSGEARPAEHEQVVETPAAPEAVPPAAPAPRPQPQRQHPAPHRTQFQPFQDGFDRFVCPEALRFLPQAYPVQHRKGLATVSMMEVDRRETEILMCNGLHYGACLWPDGELVERTAPQTDKSELLAAATSDQAAEIAETDVIEQESQEQVESETVIEPSVEPEPIFDER